MRFASPLVPARLVQRYKRFLFDAVLADTGKPITGSCPNTGSMLGLTTPGSRIWLSEHDTPTRKYRHMFEMIETESGLVGVNTGLPNKLAEEAIRTGLVGDLATYPTVERERKYGRNSRIDLLLSGSGKRPAYIEVKNVHFSRRPGIAEFPDTATKRGTKHLDELADMVDAGNRAVMLYLVRRSRSGLLCGIRAGAGARRRGLRGQLPCHSDGNRPAWPDPDGRSRTGCIMTDAET